MAFRISGSLRLHGSLMWSWRNQALPSSFFRFKATWIPDKLPVYIDGFNNIPQLDSANDMVKKIFSLQEAANTELRKVIRTINADKYDTALEKNIANNTAHIRMLVDLLQKRKNPAMKVFLIWCIDQRKKRLRKLQNMSVEKYESIIRDLEIPALQDPHARQNKYKFRKYKINVPLVKRRKVEDFEQDRVY